MPREGLGALFLMEKNNDSPQRLDTSERANRRTRGEASGKARGPLHSQGQHEGRCFSVWHGPLAGNALRYAMGDPPRALRRHNQVHRRP